MIRAVIFDCDGVLLDSESIYLTSLVDYLSDIGVNTTIEEVTFVVGMKGYDIALALQKKFSLDHIDVKEIEHKQDEYLENAMRDIKLTPMDNLISFLDLLKENGIKVAIASSSVATYVRDVSQRIGIMDYIDLMVCGDQVSNSKPDPEIFNKTVKLLNLKKEECLIIEDSVNGITAANHSGIVVVGYKGSAIIQNTSQSDYEIMDFNELTIQKMNEILKRGKK